MICARGRAATSTGALFTALFELFTANVTGNLVYLVIEAYSPLRVPRAVVCAAVEGKCGPENKTKIRVPEAAFAPSWPATRGL